MFKVRGSQAHFCVCRSLAQSLSYLSSSTTGGKRKSSVVTTTVWIFCDVDTVDGRRFLLTALSFLEESSVHSRFALIPTGRRISRSGRELLSVWSTGELKEVRKALENWTEGGDEENGEGKKFLQRMELGEGSKGVVVTGRLIGPLGKTESFELGDWSLIEKFSHDACPKHLSEFRTDKVDRS
jgi:hypothetical protein